MSEYCVWCKDEICVNADCPICCDYCPVVDYTGVCKYEELPADDENVVALFESGRIQSPTVKDAALFCRESKVGSHKCNVQTKYGWCCDICIEDELLYLTSQGIHTINSCCGHGNERMATVLVTGENSKEKMIGLGYEFVGLVGDKYSEWLLKTETIRKKYVDKSQEVEK